MWFLFKILHVRGRNSCLCKGELCFILLGGVFTSLLFYKLLLASCTRSCDHFYIYCAYLWYIYIYDDNVCLLHLSFACVVPSLSLYACFFMYAIFISITHMMPWWILFVFQKNKLWKPIMSWTLFWQSFSRVCSKDWFIL